MHTATTGTMLCPPAGKSITTVEHDAEHRRATQDHSEDEELEAPEDVDDDQAQGAEVTESNGRSESPRQTHSVYVEAIEQAYQAEGARRKSLEDRAARVITTSGALGTVLLGIVKFSDGTSPSIDAPEAASLVAALFFFGMAAILALLTIIPRPQRVIADWLLDQWVSESKWDEYDPEMATHEVARDKVNLTVNARIDNRGLGVLAFIATIFEVLAVVCVALAIAFIVEVHPALYAIVLTVGVATVIALVVISRFSTDLAAIWRKPSGDQDKATPSKGLQGDQSNDLPTVEASRARPPDGDDDIGMSGV